MAADLNGDGPEHQAEQERDRVKRAAENGDITDTDAELILEFLDAMDPGVYGTQPGEVGTKSYSTIAIYGQNIRLLAKAAPAPLAELGPAELNDVFTDMDVGQNTLSQRQAATRVFYRYHDQLDIDEDLITIERPKRTPVNPRDLLDREEIDALHEACQEDRDRAMMDLMLYTGQRIRAVQTLKVGDIDLEQNRFYLNTDAAGLKGAEGMRPLLIARRACADWMEDHPASDDPDAYFITKLPGAAAGDVHSPLHQSTINRRFEDIAKRAGIDRWADRDNAHNLRHTFVRWAFINRDMDIQTIKWMMGHAKDSQTLERTYMNILETDFARKAEEAAGVKSADEPEDHVTPEVCPFCEYGPLPDGSRACPRCTNILTPDGVDAARDVQQDIGAEQVHAEAADVEGYSAEEIQAMAEDDELLARLIEARAERNG